VLSSTEVPVNNLHQPSVVTSNLIQTLPWKKRKVKFIKKAEKNSFEEVILRIIPLIGADKVIENKCIFRPPDLGDYQLIPNS
jgi:mRNA interferase MazF